MKAKTLSGSTVEEIQHKLSECLSNADEFSPNLAVVFLSIKQDRTSLGELFAKNHIDVFGATSAGEFTDGHQSEGEVVVMLLDINRDYYRIFLEEVREENQTQAALNIAEKAKSEFKNPGFIICSSLLTSTGKVLDGEKLVHDMEEILGRDSVVFGGMAGDDVTFSGTYVFNNTISTDYGIIVLALDRDKISLEGMAISGWKPMGISRTVTKSNGNLVYTIDNQPALEMYLRYLGNDIFTSERDQVLFFNSVGVHYPLQIEREGRDPKMCTAYAYDSKEKALIFESAVPQGSKFRFSIPPDFDIVDSVLEKANNLKHQIQDNAEAVLIFSCVGRHAALGPMAHEENEGLHRIWNAPMAGFYTYGEIGKGENGKHEFYSTTCSWVALKEK